MSSQKTEVELGFPAIDGFSLHTHVDCCSPAAVVLWFYRQSADLSSITNIHLFLVGGRMLHTDVALDPFFPPVASCAVEKPDPQGLNILKIEFVQGELTFSFHNSFFVRSQQPLGHVPDELRSLSEGN